MCNDMLWLYLYIIPCIVSTILYAIISYTTLKPNKIGDLFHCFSFIPFMNIIACFVLIMMSGCFLLGSIEKISIKRDWENICKEEIK